jgi:hypothetical protein
MTGAASGLRSIFHPYSKISSSLSQSQHAMNMSIIDIALLASLGILSYTYWCNVGTGINDIMPLIQNRLGQYDISIAQRVKGWELLTLS